MRVDQDRPGRSVSFGKIFLIAVAALSLFFLGSFMANRKEDNEQDKIERTDLSKIAVALRENKNRLEVYKISGNVTTVSRATGGWWDIFEGKLVVNQPWSVAYLVDLSSLSLEDYIWDEQSRTLLIRAPRARPEQPNIDESRQRVDYDGRVITREMQTKLRNAVASGAKAQAIEEAGKPEHLDAANGAAIKAIKNNVEAPLKAVGLGDINIQVISREKPGLSERWDVSRSIAEALATRAGQ